MHNDRLVIRIEDNDLGITHRADGEGQNGEGIRIIKCRMEVLGGTFDIEVWDDKGANGTRVTCSVPLEDITRETS